MSVYLDNAAACPCDSDTIDFYRAVMVRFFANQESMGFHGAECACASPPPCAGRIPDR